MGIDFNKYLKIKKYSREQAEALAQYVCQNTDHIQNWPEGMEPDNFKREVEKIFFEIGVLNDRRD